VCGRFHPESSIESKGNCKNSYCPVVLDASSGCGRRGWIHRSLLEKVVCEKSSTVSSFAPEPSTKPSARVSTHSEEDNLIIDLEPAVESQERKQATRQEQRISCYKSTANNLNVRYQKGLRHKVCGKMMRGDKLASKGECEDGWCPVEIKNCGGRGWIAKRFLTGQICKASEVSTDFGLSAGVYWEDESYPKIGMRPGLMGQNDGGQSCTPRGIKESRCQRLIKMNAHAALGLCLPDGDALDLEELMSKHKALRRSLSKVLMALESIGDGLPHFQKSKGVNIIFDNGRSYGKYSRRHGNQIQLRGGGQNRKGCAGHSKHNGVDNIALITHELAHYVGNSKGYYDLMKATGGKYCMVSNYSDGSSKMTYKQKIAEHFAENFAAYVLLPERFKNKGPACDKAFNYMKRLFGEPDMTKSCIARKRSYKIKGSGEYNENNQRQKPAADDAITWVFPKAADHIACRPPL